jgi:threonine synthase
MLDIAYDWPRDAFADGFARFEGRALTKGPRLAAGAAATRSALDFSGVWRFRELFPFWLDGASSIEQGEASIVTVGEGKTNLQRADQLARLIGLDPDAGAASGTGGLYLQYEGFNPSGSFKDNGMAAGFTHARMVNANIVACASTGNTSASLAMYAALTGQRCYVFIGDGKIAFGKLSQALEYGGITLQVAGDFDACLARVREIAETMPELGVYLMNSVNPFRLEGQKSIMCRVLEGLDWQVPDWIVVPGGNLGNCSAFGKAFLELKALGLISRIPRLAVINAHGARTLDRIYNEQGIRWTPTAGQPNSLNHGGTGVSPVPNGSGVMHGQDACATDHGVPRLGGSNTQTRGDRVTPDYLAGTFDQAKVKAEYARMDAADERAHTIASAIEINRPVNLAKALRALWAMNGVVRSVDDHCIREHKALVGRFGFGCEPASAASVGGARNLIREGIIKPHERVVCILTGHVLKDPDATVMYHTGVDTKADGKAHNAGPKADISIPLGRVANRPIRVANDMAAILKAMGLG